MDYAMCRAIGPRAAEAYDWLQQRASGASVRELRDALGLRSRQHAWEIVGRLERAGLARRTPARVGGDSRIHAMPRASA